MHLSFIICCRVHLQTFLRKNFEVAKLLSLGSSSSEIVSAMSTFSGSFYLISDTNFSLVACGSYFSKMSSIISKHSPSISVLVFTASIRVLALSSLVPPDFSTLL